jgi:hypothetical protein
MAPETPPDPVGPAPDAARRPYAPPRLVVHGPIRDLARAAADNASGVLPDA